MIPVSGLYIFLLWFFFFFLSSEQIGALADQHIVHVACGESHSLALSDRGQLFSWGAGSDGQLGLVTTEDSVAVPR